MNRVLHLFLHTLWLILVSTSLALGAGVNISPLGNGAFVIQGTGMSGIAGIDLNLTYDTASLGAPTVTQGSLITGALMAVNPNVAGAIKIAVVSNSPMGATGPIATVSFGTHTGTGRLSVSSVSMIDKNGAPVPAAGAAFANDFQTGGSESVPPPSPLPTASSPTTVPPPPAATASPSGSGLPSVLGSVTMPGTTAQPGTGAVEPSVPAAAPTTPETPPKATEQPATEKPTETVADSGQPGELSYPSVMERFRTDTGERSPSRLSSLFAKALSPSPLIRQEPPIAVNDGKTTLRIIVDLPQKAGNSPHFALSGAKMISLKPNDEGKWILEALPQAKVLKASISVLDGKSLVEVPLTLVPPLAGSFALTEAEFSAFLKDSGAKAPLYDLNGDGRHDYQDDYIYTAHQLIKKKAIPPAR